MNRIYGWLWAVADHMDWYNRPPKRFWSWLLLKLDERDGQDWDYERDVAA
jgi:hypothetical protein